MNTQHEPSVAATVAVKHVSTRIATSSAHNVKVMFGVQYFGGGTVATHVTIPLPRKRTSLASVLGKLTDKERDAVRAAKNELLESMRDAAGGALAPLTFYRLKAGLTQETLATRAEMHQSKISYFENNPDRLTVKAAKRLAAVLGVDFKALLG